LSQISTGIGDHIRMGIPPLYVTKPTRSTQPCIPQSRDAWNWIQAFIGCGKGRNVTSAGWQFTQGDPIRHVAVRLVAIAVPRYLLTCDQSLVLGW